MLFSADIVAVRFHLVRLHLAQIHHRSYHISHGIPSIPNMTAHDIHNQQNKHQKPKTTIHAFISAIIVALLVCCRQHSSNSVFITSTVHSWNPPFDECIHYIYPRLPHWHIRGLCWLLHCLPRVMNRLCELENLGVPHIRRKLGVGNT